VSISRADVVKEMVEEQRKKKAGETLRREVWKSSVGSAVRGGEREEYTFEQKKGENKRKKVKTSRSSHRSWQYRGKGGGRPTQMARNANKEY